MRLRQLHVKNFRKIDDLTVDFPSGLAVLVGENNAGKTAIIDALRFLLFPGRDFDAVRLREDDFRIGTDFAAIELSCVFCDLDDIDEVHFQECLVDIGNGKFEARISSRAEFNSKSRRANVKSWGGESEGGNLPSNLYDHIATVYLKPLRDPASGLRPSSHSQVARLINCLTPEESQGDFEAIARDANQKIRELDAVSKARADVNTQMAAMAGTQLTQNAELVFSEPAFHRIIAGLHPEIDGLPFELNGLGYNNLVYTAATLGTLDRSEQFSFRSILIEEPEAHLHPHLQVLLLRHFAKVAEREEGNQVQVIASSHSPILASQAPIDAVVLVSEVDERVTAVSVNSIDIDVKLKKKLERYLDATRAELFFARRVLMVEGVAEALVLPVLARIAGGCLKDAAVTIVNADGINFNAFIPLFGEGRLTLPVVILTDGDQKGDKPISDATKGLKAKESEIPNLRVQFSKITFEHELARHKKLLPHLLDAFIAMHPKVGEKLKKDLDKLQTQDDKADAFYAEFNRVDTRKGEFAQEFASRVDFYLDRIERVKSYTAKADDARAKKVLAVIQHREIQTDSVPSYIRDAFGFLQVIKENEGNGKAG